jgi:uncharacterized membrane protein YgdD (TMEM256/DUF423 family)
LMTLLWSLYPLLFSQARGIIVLTILTGALALFGWATGMHVLVVWSGALGLFNLTLTLVITAQPPNVWMGLSAGITLLALLDSSQRFAYVRHCHVEPGVLTAWLAVFSRIAGLSLTAGIALVLLVVNLPTQGGMASGVGVLTIVGASLFVGVLALLLLYTSRWPERE